MGVFDKPKNDGNWVFAPKTGEADVEYTVTGGIERIETQNPKLSYTDKNGAKGYYDLLDVDGDKKLFISAWKLYFALQDCDPDEGDTIVISHPERGVYKVTKK